MQKVPAAAPPSRAGPWRAPAVRWQHEPALQPGPAPEPRLRPLGRWGWASRDTAWFIIPAGLCCYLLGSLIGIHCIFGLPDTFGLEFVQLTPRPQGFFEGLLTVFVVSPAEFQGTEDPAKCSISSARVAETLLLLPTKPVSVPTS